MPRKKQILTEAYYDYFPSRLRDLLKKRGKTQQDLAEFLSKTRQAISYYADGQTSPDWKTIVNIARYFQVSTDYLLGLSDIDTTDSTTREIHKKTGLSQKSIEILRSKVEDSDHGVSDLLSHIIVQYDIDDIVDAIRDMNNHIENRHSLDAPIGKHGHKINIPVSEVYRTYIFTRLTEIFERFNQEI